MYLTSSVFGEKTYGKCLETYKKRLQLVDPGTGEPVRGDLRALVNVTMSPWPTDTDLLKKMIDSFMDVARQEVKRCETRNTVKPCIHGFVVQGRNDRIHLVHMPKFNEAKHRWQLIIAADLPDAVRQRYLAEREAHPDDFFTVANTQNEVLGELVESLKNGQEHEFRLDKGVPTSADQEPLMKFKLNSAHVVVEESMAFNDLDTEYPEKMPFYLYGNSRNEVHIDHVLKSSPNAHISADCVVLDSALNEALSDELLKKGVVATLDHVYERSMQPL